MTDIIDILGSAQRKVTIGGQASTYPDPTAEDLRRVLSNHPEAAAEIDALMREHGTNPRFLSAGVEHSAIDLGNEKVMRLGPLSQREPSNVVAAPTLQKTIGGMGVEVYPKLNTQGITEQHVAHVKQQLSAQGLEWGDAGTDNLGRDAEGNLKIFDGRVTYGEGYKPTPADQARWNDLNKQQGDVMEHDSKIQEHLKSVTQQAEKLTGHKVVGIEQEHDRELEKRTAHARTLSELIDRSRGGHGRER